jgi:hypothetical protein
MNYILASTKELLGVPSTVTEFDTQLVVYINMVLTTLSQIGIGSSSDVYQITLTEGDLEEFLPDSTDIYGVVQMYIYTKVRLQFDPPATAFVLAALQASIAEYEWRLQTYAVT